MHPFDLQRFPANFWKGLKFLQNIILPYAFLMNTRENKYRIVDQGWIHVLRNTLNISSMCPGCSRRDDVEPINDKENNDKATIYIVSRNVHQMPLNIAKSSAQNNNPEVCNINVPKKVKYFGELGPTVGQE